MERKANRIARLPLEPLAALLLGGAVAFFCLAMPGAMLARMLAAIRLDQMLPPLGPATRALVAGGAGLGALLLAGACFALIGRKPRVPHDSDADYEPDFSTDSPAARFEPQPLRPLRAQSELGPPLPAAPEAPTAPEAPAAPEAPLAAEPPLTPPAPESVAALMARLESGLARRARREDPRPGATVTPLKPAPDIPAPTEDSLRSALEELQRMARTVR